MLEFYGHPTCSTCKDAEKWLLKHAVPYEWKNIKEERPDRELMRQILESGQLTRRRLFNTNGNLYKEMGLKDKLDGLSTEETLDHLEQDGMLIRRPFITDGNAVTVGFKEEMYRENWQG